jgi:uncharacterized Ntn-hydrolase superfamily protein
MKHLISSLLLVLVLLPTFVSAQHTFSIVASDPMTGEVGSAGATCLSSSDCGGCGGAIIISGVLPGLGAANAQATVCIPNVNLNSIINRMSLGNDASSCLNTVLTFDGCQFGDTSNRQYGIVTLDSNSNLDVASFTGSNALNFAGHRTGPNYSIQGNILLGPQVLDSMEAGFNNTNGPLCEKLMAALQGANIAGADSRCLNDGVSSKSAFIRVARLNDTQNNFWLDLNVPEVAQGVEPIDSLQVLFDAFKSQVGLPISPVLPRFLVYPNPIATGSGLGLVKVDYQALDPVEPFLDIYDLQGRRLNSFSLPVTEGLFELDVREYGSGGLFVVYRDAQAGISITRKLILTH